MATFAGTLAVLIPLLMAPMVRAQGTVADGVATFALNTAHFDTSPAANFTGVSSPTSQDHLFEEGWWYRVSGDTAEKFFPPPNLQSYVGSVATLTWSDVDGRGFSAQKTDEVMNGGGPSGQVTLSLTITNSSATTPLTIDVFHVADVDLTGTAGSDSAGLVGPGLIQLTDGAQTAQYAGAGADAFLVRPFGATDVPAVLSNAVVDDFNDTGLPFGPGDFTAGFQWAGTTIDPSASATFVAVIAVNMAATVPTTTTTSSTSTSSTTTSSSSSTSSSSTSSSSTSSSSTSSTSTSSTSTPVVTTTSTTAPGGSIEACDNCQDDDADGLVDFEDDDCCSPGASATLVLKKGRLRARPGGLATAKLRATLSHTGLADGATFVQDLTIQIRRQGQGQVLCARIPATSLGRTKTKSRFRDRGLTIASARGIEDLTLAESRDGSGRLSIGGRRVLLAIPLAGPLAVTLGLRDPATAEVSNRCSTGVATFRATKTGLRFP